MEEELISFQVAKLAKEKGFDGFCFDAYNTHKMKYSNGWLEYIDDNEIEIPFTSKVLKSKDILAPTQSLLQKWLREEHSIDVLVDKGFLSNKYSYEVLYKNNMLDSEYIFKTFEEALEKGLYESLKLI